MNKGPILKFTNPDGTPVFIDRSEIKGYSPRYGERHGTELIIITPGALDPHVIVKEDLEQVEKIIREGKIKKEDDDHEGKHYYVLVGNLLHMIDQHINWWQGHNPNTGKYKTVIMGQVREIEEAYAKVKNEWPKFTREEPEILPSLNDELHVISVGDHPPYDTLIGVASIHHSLAFHIPLSWVSTPGINVGDIIAVRSHGNKLLTFTKAKETWTRG